MLLVRNRSRLVTRDEILAQIWGINHYLESESAVNTAIRKLRRWLPAVSHLEDLIAAWNVIAARENAWKNAEHFRNLPLLPRSGLTGTIDGSTAVISKVLLVPVPQRQCGLFVRLIQFVDRSAGREVCSIRRLFAIVSIPSVVSLCGRPAEQMRGEGRNPLDQPCQKQL